MIMMKTLIIKFPNIQNAMKKILSLTLILFLGLQLSSVAAQSGAKHRKNGRRTDVPQLVSNLTDNQKSRLETLTTESRQRVDALRSQQKSVRDSIARYMALDGDQTKQLYPLFDREAKIQSDISREMYATKVRIDALLTPEQRQELQSALHKQRQKHPKKQ